MTNRYAVRFTSRDSNRSHVEYYRVALAKSSPSHTRATAARTPTPNTLGGMTPTEILATRKRYGLSQTELAVLLRLNPKTIRRWEKGEVPITGPASIVIELMAADELPNRYWP